MSSCLLHNLLESSSRRAPDQIAVICRAQTLSYRELDQSSTRLALVLRHIGVAKGDRIGLVLDKSIEAVIAIFGILKAGAAYVPTDPNAPPRRAAFIIDDCAIRVLVTTRERMAHLRPELASMPTCVVLPGVDKAPEVYAGERAPRPLASHPPVPGPSGDDLAYILYTSGSTGEPKGVMISHRGALSFVSWAVHYFRLRPDDRLANHAPLHFDLSIFDLFGAAAAGATVAFVPPGVSIFPRTLADWIEESRISVWYSVPSALTQLALHGGLERHAFSRLRLVLFAGEVFPVPHLRRLMEQVPRAEYFNLYGPTETNVCTVHAVGAPPDDDVALPIGRACANNQVFALNEHGNLLRPGQTGELYVRGPNLMQGYWGRPEQTNEVLTPHPLCPEQPGRVYHTGDLVRLDEEGNYHFVGRRDAQVKSRGYRIEPGEVEAALHRHPAVAEAAVFAQPHAEFGSVLLALVVVREGSTLSRGELTAFCAGLLPPYMIPGNFSFLPELPKTSNGKLDRAALRDASSNSAR